jgi:hypothetical protein
MNIYPLYDLHGHFVKAFKIIRVLVEKEILKVEQESLAVEKERLATEKDRLIIDG